MNREKVEDFLADILSEALSRPKALAATFAFGIALGVGAVIAPHS
jgi:hypothetical protein